MKLINLNAISLSTGKELLSIPLDYVENDLETEHKVKSLSNTANLTIECGTVNNNALSKLIGKMPDKYDNELKVGDKAVYFEFNSYVQVRKHKKKRINKKWAKRYGYKCVTKTTKGWKLKTYTDGSFEFIK